MEVPQNENQGCFTTLLKLFFGMTIMITVVVAVVILVV